MFHRTRTAKDWLALFRVMSVEGVGSGNTAVNMKVETEAQALRGKKSSRTIT